ncbi:MAG TPA: amidohydrolase family protein [Chloroflexota bacterium]
MVVESRPRLTLGDVLVVDVDVHAHESPEELTPYMDPRWRPAMENVARIPHRYLDRPGFAPVSSPRLLGAAPPSPRGGRLSIVWTAEQMRRELDELSIDIGVVFPDHFLKIAGLAHADYVGAITQAYHRWLKERWLSADNDLYAVLMANPHDPEASAREIERWADDERFVGVYFPTCQVYPMWGHRQYDPLYEVAQHHDLPVFLHAVGGLASGFPYNVEQFHTSVGTHTASHVFAMMGNIITMMETGVPVRFPRLRLCFAEAGLTWVPFLRMRLDKEFTEKRSQMPHFDDRPSRWIRRFYFATQPVEEPENRQDLVDIIRIYDGEDTTVFASDWPHHDFDHPRAVFDLPVSDRLKRKFLGANALKLMPRISVPVEYGQEYRRGETL